MKPKSHPDRREFLGSLAKGAAAIGLTTTAINTNAALRNPESSDLDAWFNTIKGKHRMVFDAVSANDGFSVIWSYTFLTSNNQTGSADNDLTAMVVLRSKAIPLAFTDKLWSKFKLGKMFKLIDYETNASAERNLYWDPKPGEMPEDGMSIKSVDGTWRDVLCLRDSDKDDKQDVCEAKRVRRRRSEEGMDRWYTSGYSGSTVRGMGSESCAGKWVLVLFGRLKRLPWLDVNNCLDFIQL
jgi:hypothetical protein